MNFEKIVEKMLRLPFEQIFNNQCLFNDSAQHKYIQIKLISPTFYGNQCVFNHFGKTVAPRFQKML